MKCHRLWYSLALVAATAGSASAQSVFLGEANLKDACFNVELTMRLKGTVAVQQPNAPKSFPRTAEATHSFFERVLDADGARIERTARFYNRAEATIADGGEPFKLILKANHALLVAHRLKEQLVVYHPIEPLSREETEVASHFDTLAVVGLLPGREVKVGDTWAVSRDVVQALTDLDAVEKAEVTGKLVKVDGDFAYLSFAGEARGIDMAAPVAVLVKDATAAFNLKLKRLTQVEWRVSDERKQGPVSPGLAADVAFSLKRIPIDPPAQLGAVALVRVPNGPPPANLTNIAYRHFKKGFEFQFSREWHVVSQTADGKLVLRLIDARGEFIAQCAVTPWRKVDSSNQMKLAEFSKMMRESQGWKQKDGPPLDETDRIKAASGYSIFRVTAEGKLGDVDALRSFYLVSTPDGNQVLVDFTMLPSHAAKLDGRDLALVQSIQFLAVDNRIEAIPASQPRE